MDSGARWVVGLTRDHGYSSLQPASVVNLDASCVAAETGKNYACPSLVVIPLHRAAHHQDSAQL